MVEQSKYKQDGQNIRKKERKNEENLIRSLKILK